MVHVLDQQFSIVNHFLHELRDKDIQKDRAKFRHNLKKIGQVMAYEVSKQLEHEERIVQTPLSEAKINLMKEIPVLVTILRAAMPFAEGFLDYFDQADMAFVGAYRKEGEQIEIHQDYLAAPSVENKVVILIDPMLATGKSLVTTCNILKKRGLPKSIHFVSVVAAPEGIDYIAAHLPEKFTIWTASLDEKLNEHSYIVPGLGDAGDLSYGIKE